MIGWKADLFIKRGFYFEIVGSAVAVSKSVYIKAKSNIRIAFSI